MTHLQRALKREEGQSVIILGAVLLGFIALLALVVDTGNAYVQRRIAQNATDAAALAAGTELAMTDIRDSHYTGGRTDEERIWQAVIRVAEANGIPDTNGVPGDRINDNLVAYFINAQGERVPNTENLPNNRGVPRDKDIAGVAVESTLNFNTYFARLIGFQDLETGANALALAPPDSGVCSAGNLFPIAVSQELFQGEGEGRVAENKPVLEDKEYQIFEKDRHSEFGNFGWVSWDNDPSNTTLVTNMNDTSRSGTWSVGDRVPGAVGVQVSRGVEEALRTRIDDSDPNRPAEVIVPVYNNTTGRGNNLRYEISGFAKFRITGYHFGGNRHYGSGSESGGRHGRGRDQDSGNKWIKGYFEQWVNSSAEGGCSYFGGGTAKLREPLEQTRKVVGTIDLNELIPESQPQTSRVHVPVDVMLVTDISGSMEDRWSAGQTKLQSAKETLTLFNDQLQPDEGDRVGLTTFPRTFYTGWYRTPCGPWHYYGYTSDVRSGLTDNIDRVNGIINSLRANGGTSLAHGIMQGRNQLLNDLHDGSVPVLIVASDGIANITTDGRWTGFPGNSGEGERTPSCNNQAEKQASDQAALARANDVIVFSIAIGDGFNTELLRAIATPDHDADGDGDIERYFFKATDKEELRNIYEHLATRIETIGQEDEIHEQRTPARGAVVELRNVDTGSTRTTHTNDAGAFAFQDIEPGTYRLTAYVQLNGLTYDILTDGYGGPALDPQYVEVEVGTGQSDTETVVMFLETDDLKY